ncbi:Divalent metal cation transporter MntH [Acidibacillus sp. S0AB]|uniref:Divalent metal cation transporter MntH n=1 Tax=Sulfoacidibacillus ferrooxidans TaxID=2005001 RepID=A0A9X1V8I3_9BACL|nr:Divalent metal cation transporter MntH [Sulfoacidibacillus ferrooxidans]
MNLKTGSLTRCLADHGGLNLKTNTAAPSRFRGIAWKSFLLVMGPGMIVMLADSDVGSVITAAQCGAEWGYKLLLVQFILMPILYMVQELTVRLGIFTGKGHGELIRETFGPIWAWISLTGLTISAAGGLLTEFSGLAGVSVLFGIPRIVGVLLGAVFLLVVVYTGSYRRVERIALFVGLFELVFFGIAIISHPNLHTILVSLGQIPLTNSSYLFLISASIGAVIMPFMIFYQQSAVTDKGLGPDSYRHARLDTAIGAVVTQGIMAAVLIATAATIGRVHPDASLNTVGQLSQALTPFLGHQLGRDIFAIGMIGAGAVAAMVEALGFAWGFGEVTGVKHSLEHHVMEAPWFYGVFTCIVIVAAGVVILVHNLISLDIVVEVVNAFLLPLVLGLLVGLAIKSLPLEHRLRGWYKWVVIFTVILTAGLGVYGGLTVIPGFPTF